MSPFACGKTPTLRLRRDDDSGAMTSVLGSPGLANFERREFAYASTTSGGTSTRCIGFDRDLQSFR